MDRLPRERRAASGGEPTREQNGLVAQGSKVDFAERAAGSGGGELETGIDLAGTTRYEYTIFGNVRRVELPGGDVMVDFVDARNRRIAMKVNGVVTHRFLWQSDLRIAAEVDSTGQVLTRYVYGTQINVPDLMIRDGATCRILHDHLGSPRLVVNTTTGAIVHRMDFDEWGNVTLDTNPGFHPFGFAGGLYDSDTGLVRFGARDYDPTVGRWTAKDPLGFGALGSNLLVYAAGDPVNRRDPAGSADQDSSVPANQFPHGPDPLVVGCAAVGTAVGVAENNQRRYQRVLEEADEGSRVVHPGLGEDHYDFRDRCERANRMPADEIDDKSWKDMVQGFFEDLVAAGLTLLEAAGEMIDRMFAPNPPPQSCTQ